VLIRGDARTNRGQFQKGQHWRPRRPWYDRAWLIEAYARQSTGDIAKAHGVTDAAILFWLKKHQIPARDISTARALKHWGADGSKNPMYGKRGALNPHWKGGHTPARQAMYASAEWRATARAVKRRDPVCRRCGSAGRLEIHHITSFADAPLLATALGNVIRLCQPCHKRTLGRERWWSKRLYRLIRGLDGRAGRC